jgi:NAD(P)-dependent dehydrogenase (short-subunit alcohol dehydrogenase family)
MAGRGSGARAVHRGAATSTATRQPLQCHTALVTGATGGIGHHTARALARCGARVIITGRNGDTGQQAAEAIARESGSDSVTCMSADHSTVGGNQDLVRMQSGEAERPSRGQARSDVRHGNHTPLR